eukprot:353977-Chlamydomonas_euryale.AAC.1
MQGKCILHFANQTKSPYPTQTPHPEPGPDNLLTRLKPHTLSQALTAPSPDCAAVEVGVVALEQASHDLNVAAHHEQPAAYVCAVAFKRDVGQPRGARGHAVLEVSAARMLSRSIGVLAASGVAVKEHRAQRRRPQRRRRQRAAAQGCNVVAKHDAVEVELQGQPSQALERLRHGMAGIGGGHVMGRGKERRLQCLWRVRVKQRWFTCSSRTQSRWSHRSN